MIALMSTYVEEYREGNMDKGVFAAGSIRATIFILLSASLGVGMLSIPRAFERSGLILSSILVLSGGIVSYLSMKCLVRASSHTELVAMGDLALWAYGMKFKYFSDLVSLTNNFGTAIAYSIAAKENLASTFNSFKEFGWTSCPNMLYDKHSVFWLLVTQGLLIPLVIKEKLTELRVFSLISYLIISYIALTIVGNTFMPTYTRDFDAKWDKIAMYKPEGIAYSLPVIIFGFACQQNVLGCYRELKDPTPRRMDKVLFRLVFAATAIYLMVGCFGYLTFGSDFNDQDQNILTKYNSKNISILIVGINLTSGYHGVVNVYSQCTAIQHISST